MTVWKQVSGFPNYEVSDDGGLRLKRNHMLLKQRLRKDGYMDAWLLGADGERHSLLINRAVAIAFHGSPPFPGAQAAHGDGVRTHNSAANLSWKTAKSNHADRVEHGTDPKGERNGRAVLSEADVKAVRVRLRRGELQIDIADTFRVCTSSISNIKRGVSWSHLVTNEQ